MKPGVLTVLILIGLSAGTMSAQQPVAPPQANAAEPALAATMKSLEDKLRSIGRVSWTQNALDFHVRPGTSVDKLLLKRQAFWEELTSVTADPKSCSLRVRWQTDAGLASKERFSAYLDEISVVEVLTSEKFMHRHWHFTQDGKPDYQEDVQPALYSVSVAVWSPIDFKFPNKEAAEEFAALLLEAEKQCSGPIALQRASGPGLDETLTFIAAKLESQGRVISGVTWRTIDDNSPLHYVYSDHKVELRSEYSRVSPNPTTCTMRIEGMTEENGPYTGTKRDGLVSFRRISKIEVMKYKDFLKPSGASRMGAPAGIPITETSSSVVLVINTPIDQKYLYISDETLANRIAKAMVHAAELCGAVANREPF